MRQASLEEPSSNIPETYMVEEPYHLFYYFGLEKLHPVVVRSSASESESATEEVRNHQSTRISHQSHRQDLLMNEPPLDSLGYKDQARSHVAQKRHWRATE